jgi:hypothetical protein
MSMFWTKAFEFFHKRTASLVIMLIVQPTTAFAAAIRRLWSGLYLHQGFHDLP